MELKSLDILLDNFVQNPNSLEIVQKILNHLDGFLKNITKKYDHSYWKDDIEQVARIGLLKALRKYQPHQQSSFIHFALIYINGEINHFFRDSARLIKKPYQKKSFYFKAHQYIEQYIIEYHVIPNIYSIMDYMNCEHKDAMNVLHTYQVGNKPVSYVLEDFHSHSDHGNEYINSLYIQNALSSLDQNELHLIEDFYVAGMTQKEIAKKNKISQAQVSKLIQKAIYKVRKHAA